jgi:hypothetical protein
VTKLNVIGEVQAHPNVPHNEITNHRELKERAQSLELIMK